MGLLPFLKTKRKNRLEAEVKKQHLQLMTLHDQLNHHKKVAAKFQQDYIQLSKRVKSLCEYIVDKENAPNQLGGSNPLAKLNIYELIQYTEDSIKSANEKNRELLLQLSSVIKTKEQEIEGLKAQLSRFLVREKYREEYGVEYNLPEETTGENAEETAPEAPPEKISPVHEARSPRIQIFEDDDEEEKSVHKAKNDLKNSESSTTISASRKNEAVSKNEVVAHVVNLNDTINKITDIMWHIIDAIGVKGFSESKDIKKLVVKEMGVTESAFNTSLSQLRKMNIIDQEKINTGWRWFYAYELSDLGTRIFAEKYGKNPVICEKQMLKREHTTALHGYCIKDTAHILQATFGYEVTTTDKKQNTIKLYNDKVYIPDIIAQKKQGAVVDYFEVELGHHSQKDFNEKCDKMRMVTKNLYFVVPDAGTMNNVLAKQISQWAFERGKESVKGTTIYLTTLTKLCDGKWENVYPLK